LHLVVQFANQLSPVLQADLEDLAVLDLTNANEVEVTVKEEITVGQSLDDWEVVAEEVAKEEGQVLYKLLILAV
jgi:hypothetical protein